VQNPPLRSGTPGPSAGPRCTQDGSRRHGRQGRHAEGTPSTSWTLPVIGSGSALPASAKFGTSGPPERVAPRLPPGHARREHAATPTPALARRSIPQLNRPGTASGTREDVAAGVLDDCVAVPGDDPVGSARRLDRRLRGMAGGLLPGQRGPNRRLASPVAVARKPF